MNMPEPDVAQSMLSHETTLIDITADTHDTSFTCILPHRDIPPVVKHRFLGCVHGNHQLIVVELAQQVLVVEIPVSIDQRLLA